MRQASERGCGADQSNTPLSEALMHANARLTPVGRRTLIERIQTGRPVAHVAAEMGISRATAYKWWPGTVMRAGGDSRTARVDRPVARIARLDGWSIVIEVLRRTRKLGPARIAGVLEMAPSTSSPGPTFTTHRRGPHQKGSKFERRNRVSLQPAATIVHCNAWGRGQVGWRMGRKATTFFPLTTLGGETGWGRAGRTASSGWRPTRRPR